ncbi:MAG: NAD(P)H-dependent glycerol-3-phosphate dehydrogenase [Candidatus Magasanikbacteria bacterium]|nr:NAD(P)H-dependent glycerol-3-phosphate dehydrogenase [Candidatus Magasanikbacteria bacterium]
MKKIKICVLGAGSMGTALAHLLANNGLQAVLWGIDKGTNEAINTRHENKKFLSGVILSKNISATLELETALAGAEAVVVALPVQAARSVLQKAKGFWPSGAAILSVSKGLEIKTGQTVSQIIKEILSEEARKKTAVLMGPLFASEISSQMPSVGLLAAFEPAVFRFFKNLLANDFFFVRQSEDVLGAELGGALKNVYAILLGVCDGLGYGWNAKSAAVTGVLKEFGEAGHYLGAKKETLHGLAGLGDLLTTGFGERSRNRRFGEKLAEGKTVKQALAEIGQVVEGLGTVKIAVKLLRKFKKETPFLHAVYLLAHRGQNPAVILGKILKNDI